MPDGLSGEEAQESHLEAGDLIDDVIPLDDHNRREGRHALPGFPQYVNRSSTDERLASCFFNPKHLMHGHSAN